MQPFSVVLSDNAIHAVVTLAGVKPQYAASWCQDTYARSPGNLGNQCEFHTMMSGPKTDSTASSTRGWDTSPYTQVRKRCVSMKKPSFCRGSSFCSPSSFW